MPLNYWSYKKGYLHQTFRQILKYKEKKYGLTDKDAYVGIVRCVQEANKKIVKFCRGVIDVFEYGICSCADEEIFEKQCSALEMNIPKIRKGELVVDVNGSKLQKYILGTNKINVINDRFVNEVLIRTEINLEQFFNKNN